jgi:hypothetical protein
LDAGVPIYIDKPLAHSVADARALLARQRYEGQIFSCTALRYATELQLPPNERAKLGRLIAVDARVPKSWEKYAIHVIEPMLALTDIRPDAVQARHALRTTTSTRLGFTGPDGTLYSISALGPTPVDIAITLTGEKAERRLAFADAFSAFKTALAVFVESARARNLPIPREETLAAVNFIEWGRYG